MTICKRCGKENQDHFKFCLGCGGELASAQSAAMAKTVVADASQVPGGRGMTPVPVPTGAPGAMPAPAVGGFTPFQPGPGSGVGPRPSLGVSQQRPTPLAQQAGLGPPPAAPWSQQPAPAPAPAPAAAAPIAQQPSGPMHDSAATRPCPSCGFQVPLAFLFCGACGSKLAPVAAPPAVRGPSAALPAQAPVAVAPQVVRRLTLIRPDGAEGGIFDLREGENKLGRQAGAIFENDGYLSPVHALLTIAPQGATIRDLGSLNGVFIKLTEEEEVNPTDLFRIGQELLRFDTIAPPAPLQDGTEIMGSPNPGYWGRLSLIIGKDIEASAWPLLGDAATLGRERGDINFPEDGYVSGVHARLSNRGGRFFLQDLGSSNGTFLRLRAERALPNGAFVLLGQQLFRYTNG